MTTAGKITTHEADAQKRVVSQYKDTEFDESDVKKVVRIYAKGSQELEDALFDIMTKRSINDAEGQQLDNLGTILDQPRNGLPDSTYRTRLFVKIAEITSEGTEEDLISIFGILMGARLVQIFNIPPANIALVAIEPDPIVPTNEVIAALTRARIAGVGIKFLAQVDDPGFSFAADPDPNGAGFATISIPESGGNFAELIFSQPYFTFEDDPDPFNAGFGSIGAPILGGAFGSII